MWDTWGYSVWGLGGGHNHHNGAGDRDEVTRSKPHTERADEYDTSGGQKR